MRLVLVVVAVALGLLASAALDPLLVERRDALRALLRELPGWLYLPLHHLHWGFYMAYAGVALRALWRGDRRTLHVVAVYLVAQLLIALLVVRALKIGIGRPRPLAVDGAFWPLSLDSAHHSFPSGHAADAAVGAGVAWSAGARPWLRGLAIATALVVMAMRVVELQHHPSDVVAGALLGGLGSWALARRWLRWCDARAHRRAAP
jgi:undecaprenyl-diphosphatase